GRTGGSWARGQGRPRGITDQRRSVRQELRRIRLGLRATRSLRPARLRASAVGAATDRRSARPEVPGGRRPPAGGLFRSNRYGPTIPRQLPPVALAATEERSPIPQTGFRIEESQDATILESGIPGLIPLARTGI